MAEAPKTSVVIPVHNEQDTVQELAARIGEVLKSDYELIFIDDGSTDETWPRLLSIHRENEVRLLRLRTRFGKTAALMAGFAEIRGETVFTLDGDLQDDPSEIPRFLAKLEEGYDLVTGWKKRRRDPLTKVVSSRLFNFAVRRMTGLVVRDINCGFKAFRGEAARALHIHGEMHRFIPVLMAAKGFRVGEIEVTHHPRRHGRSKYGFERMFKGFFDLVTVVLLTRFRERPAHGFGLVAMASLGATALSLVAWMIIGAASGLVPTLAVLFALAGFVFLAAGWAMEYVVALGAGTPRVPSCSVRERLD